MRTIAAALLLALAAVSAAGPAAAECAAKGNGVVLTVAGNIASPNRGPFVESADRFHAFRGNQWEKARTFTIDELAALPQMAVRTVVPYDKKSYRFEGPALAEVLKAAGAAPGSVAVQAIDGYEVELTPEIQAADKQVLALCQEGKPLGLGALGPLYTVVPMADGATPGEDQFNRQIWAVHYINVK